MATSVDVQGLMWCEHQTQGELLTGGASDGYHQLQPAVSCSSPADSAEQ